MCDPELSGATSVWSISSGRGPWGQCLSHPNRLASDVHGSFDAPQRRSLKLLPAVSFSSFKTLLALTEGIALASDSTSRVMLIVGRFSSDYVWPVLGDYRGEQRSLIEKQHYILDQLLQPLPEMLEARAKSKRKKGKD